MANGITYKLEGVKEITEILNGLPHKVRSRPTTSSQIEFAVSLRPA